MGLVIFLGCVLLAFSPAIAIFTLAILPSPRLVIITIGGAFFWQLSIMLAALWWFIIPPLQDVLFWTVPWSVLFQEAMRYLFFRLYLKAEKGFIKPGEASPTTGDQWKVALAMGVGSGVYYGLVNYVTILWQSLGPGAYYSPSCPSFNIFILSAILCCCFIIFHICWTLVSFDATRKSNWKIWGGIVALHLLVSAISLLNMKGGSCWATLVLTILLTIVHVGLTLYYLFKYK